MFMLENGSVLIYIIEYDHDRYILLEQSDLEAFLRVHKHTPLKRQVNSLIKGY